MIADDVLAGFMRVDPKRGEVFKQQLASAIVVKIQNVANYFWEGTDQEAWDLRSDFPNVAPPWPRFWMEWKLPTGLVTKTGGYQRLSEEVPRWGVGVFGAAAELENRSLARWQLDLYCFSGSPERQDPFMAAIQLLIDADGHVVMGGTEENPQAAVYAIPKADIESYGQASAELVTSASFRTPALLALCFCHCNNVTIIETPVSSKLLKKRDARDRAPVTKYYTLEIAPMQKTLREAAGADGSLKHALHICRGHFKDYREGSGLFDKFRGMYWWDMHTRGSSKLGEIRKDYDVKPPCSA